MAAFEKERAQPSAAEVVVVEISGAAKSSLNQKYDLLPQIQGAGDSPVFKKRGGRQAACLYHADDSRWHVSRNSRSWRYPTTSLRSEECDANTLPSDVRWEEPHYLRGRCVGFQASSAKAVQSPRNALEGAWQDADAEVRCAVVEVLGASVEGVDGRYDLQPREKPSSPPFFKRFGAPVGPEFWLYYATDGRWHIGSHAGLEQRRPTRRFRSVECEPGTLPCDVKVWQECEGGPYARTANFQPSSVVVTVTPTAECAWQNTMAEASSAIVDIEGCSVMEVNGRYDLQPARWSGEPPAFRRRGQGDVWLYYCSDGRWRAGGGSEDRNEWRLNGALRSAVCQPGVLPAEAAFWEESYGGFLARGCIRVSTRPRSWVDAWSGSAIEAVEISSASEGSINGIYYLRSSEDVGEPPVFERRKSGVGSSAMLLYYADEGRWHVGSRFEAGSRAYRFYKFDVTQVRSGIAVGVAKVAFLLAGQVVDMSSAKVTNPGGHNPAGAEPHNIIDDAVQSEWHDFKKKPLIIEFVVQQPADAFCFWTADGPSERDPVRWKLSGSMDGASWTVLYHQADPDACPTDRRAQTPWLALKIGARRPGHHLRSAKCEPGTLPAAASSWEEFHRGPYGVSAFRLGSATVTSKDA